ncbi:hypothetical protein P4391_34425, partial [Bacillus thuringiensis]|nr:hypothetical protein [Bacillus thuringiensis]
GQTYVSLPGRGLSFFHFNKQFILGGLSMAVLKDSTYIEINIYNEIGFFRGILWGLVFVVPFWSIIIALFILLYK